jgi:hypothetical protein
MFLLQGCILLPNEKYSKRIIYHSIHVIRQKATYFIFEITFLFKSHAEFKKLIYLNSIFKFLSIEFFFYHNNGHIILN